MRMFFILLALLHLCGSTFGDDVCNPALLIDWDFPGSDVQILYSPDAEYCQLLCTQFSSCDFFAFIGPDCTVDNRYFFCFLKMTATGQPAVQVPKQGTTAGYSLRPCNPDPRPCLSQVYEDVDFPGSDYSSLFTQTAEECQTACTADPGCQFFTFIKEGYSDSTIWYKCFLKFNWTIPFPPNVQANSDAESGFSLRLLRSQRHQRGYQSRLLPNLDCPGNDVINVPAASPQQCQALCTAHPQCTYFSYVSIQFKCYLKNNAGSRTCNAATGITSGMPVRSCLMDDSWIRMTYQGVDFPYSDIRSFSLASADLCQKSCTEDCDCQFFSFRISSLQCYLKRVITLPIPASINVLENVVSGFNLRNCRCRSKPCNDNRERNDCPSRPCNDNKERNDQPCVF